MNLKDDGKIKLRKGEIGLERKKTVIMTRLDRYDEIDKYHLDNRPFKAITGFEGPFIERLCTNCICWLIPGIVIFGLFAFVIILAQKSDPRVLLNPMDFRGQMCGIAPFASKPYIYYMAPNIDLNVAICVAECPQGTGAPIYLYHVGGETDTSFQYTQIDTKRKYGKYCYPTEPSTKKVVDDNLSKLWKQLLFGVGDLWLTID